MTDETINYDDIRRKLDARLVRALDVYCDRVGGLPTLVVVPAAMYFATRAVLKHNDVPLVRVSNVFAKSLFMIQLGDDVGHSLVLNFADPEIDAFLGILEAETAAMKSKTWPNPRFQLPPERAAEGGDASADRMETL